MKKNVFLLLIAAMSLVFISCNDDDDINGSAKSKGIEAVDLGLSVKWANVNLGASNPWDIGYRFAWGETEPRTNFYGNYGYPYYDEDTDSYVNIGNEISGTKYDAARHLLGGKWRMPTADEVEELLTKCSFYPSEQGNTSGTMITGPSGKSIFIPNCGAQDSDINDIYGKDSGFYWTGTLSDDLSRACILCLEGAYSLYTIDSSDRDDMGKPIRAVRD